MEKNDPHGIDIQTQVNYLPEQSDEAGNRFVFSYTITITISAMNRSSSSAAIDHHRCRPPRAGSARTSVVGEQPLIKPSQSSNIPAARC